MNKDSGNWMRLRKGDGSVLLFLTAAFCLCRPAMIAGFFGCKLTFFTEGLLVLLAGGILFLAARSPAERKIRELPPPEILGALAVLALSGILHWFADGFHHPDILGRGLLFVLIPLFSWHYRECFSRILIPLSLLVWMIEYAVYLLQYGFNKAPFGITGNWNWSVVLFVSCAMVSAAAFRTETGKVRKCFLIPLILPTLLFLCTEFYSRAAWASLIVTGCMFIFLCLRKKRKIVIYLLAAVLAAGGIAALTVFSDFTARSLSREIRTELFGEAVSLIREHPLGVGVSGYENAIVSYKTDAYFLHPDSAVRTVHPHNELLNIASTLGIPAAIAWLVLMLSILIRFFLEDDAGKHTLQQRLYFSAWFFIFICSGADILLHTWPVNWYFALLTGVLIPSQKTEKQTPVPRTVEEIIGAGFIVSAILFAGFNFLNSLNAMCVRKGGAWSEKKLALYAFSETDPEEIYYFAVTSLTEKKNIPLARRFAAVLQRGPWPDYAHIHRLLANMYAMEGQHTEALKEYEKDLLCHPYNPASLYGKINALGRLGRIAEAETLRQQLSKLLVIRNMDEKEFYRKMQPEGKTVK